MDIILYSMLPVFVVITILLVNGRARFNCPDCGASLPQFLSPFQKTRRMWRSGGYLCAQCGCETNRAGEKIVAHGTLVPIPAARWVKLSVALLVGVGLCAALLWTAPKRIESMPRIALPQQAVGSPVH
ncbi:MAG: hypothetical protein ACREJD_10290 [Phycisphaerales bacterium]